MSSRNSYTVGGTVAPDSRLYIPRRADKELLDLCRSGEFTYILTSRQLGKSSLMVRTAKTLTRENIKSVIIDLTQLGVQVSAEAWYLGILIVVQSELGLKTDVINWWQSHSNLGVTHRLTNFFQQVVLAEVTEQIVIFVDEIDTTLSLDFTDDFYAAIRFLFNNRARAPELSRLSFVLIGVATPSDLIKDAKRTPFNIGKQLDLTDFTFEEAKPLAADLNISEAFQVLDFILKWTGGHPYLTQRLCQAVARRNKTNWSAREVEMLIFNTILGEDIGTDHNLRFVNDMLTRRAPDPSNLLAMFEEIRFGEDPIYDEEHSLIKSHLKLSGVVRVENGILKVRNLIYETVFNRQWLDKEKKKLFGDFRSGAVEQNLPADEDLKISTPPLHTTSGVDKALLEKLQTILGTTYHLETMIGKSDIATVFKGHHPALGRDVTVKVLAPELVRLNPHFSERFQEIMTAVTRLSLPDPHPSILPVHDFGIAQEYSYIVMAYKENRQSLAGMLNQPMEYKTAVELIGQVADAVAYAHRHGIVHGELKASNILILDYNQLNNQVLVTDFGIGLLLSTVTKGKRQLPSFALDPVQKHRQEIDYRADIYGLGTLFFQLLVGVETDSATIEQIEFAHGIPTGVKEIIRQATAADPNDRPQSVKEFMRALRKIDKVSTDTVEAPLSSSEKTAIPEASQIYHSLAWIILILMGLLIVLGVALLIVLLSS